MALYGRLIRLVLQSGLWINLFNLGKSMKRIVFAISDTGHGHRAAADAISTALQMRYGDSVICETVDIFKDYTIYPFRRFPDFYPKFIKYSSYLYGAAFKFSNT